MTLATKQVATGQIIRVVVPQWFRSDKKLPSRELVGTVGRIFAKAYDLENVFAVVRQSDKCLRCDSPIASAIMQRIGYCDACAAHVGAPAPLDIDAMEWNAVKKRIHDATALRAVTLPHEVSNVLDILRDAPALVTQPVAAKSQLTQKAKAPVAISINEEVDPTQHRVLVRGGSILVECFGKYNKKVYDACKAIGGGKWSAPDKAWVFPARPVTASRVKNALGVLGLDVSDAGLQRLIDEAINADVAMSIKNIDIKALTQPQGVRYPLWAHQLRAFSFANLFSGCGLFMAMGTGKSLVTVALIAARKAKTVLIVSPKSVIDVWEDELAKHAMFAYELLLLNKPGMSTVKKVAAAKEAIARAKQRGVPAIIVTNYETAIRPPMGPKYEQVEYEDMYGAKKKRNKLKDPGFIASQQFDMIIADEAHKLMHHTSLTSRVFSYYSPTTPYRLVLTGTPLGHDPLSIYGIYRFAN
ncbi:MAG: SNF2-related protein, partial [Ktedonobacterales bacterium]